MKIKRIISMVAVLCLVFSMLNCMILPAAAIGDAVTEMESLVSYFERSYAQADAALAQVIEKAKQISADSDSFGEDEVASCLDALKSYRNKAPYLPRVSQVDQYPGESGYMIFEISDLLYIANNATNTAKFNSSQTIYLGGDLDLTDVSFWPIPKAEFSFDGMGHTISNWTGKSKYDYQAFFQEYKGKSVKNVTFKDFDLESGYSRAALISELKTADTLLIENVNMENVRINAVAGGNSNQNRMGLYISRNTSTSPHCDVTIRNCQIKNCKLTNDNGLSTVNESGLIAGYIRNDGDFKLENIVVLNSSSEVETGDGGLLLGNLETSGAVTFENVAVIGGTITNGVDAESVGIMVGIHTNANTPSFKNCLVYGVTSNVTQVWARGWNDRSIVDQSEVVGMGVTAENCVIDILNPYVGVAKNTGRIGEAAGFGYIQGLAGVETLTEAVWSVNRGKALAPVFYLSEDAASVSVVEKSGYYLPKKINFVSGSGEDAVEIASFYTRANGKLPAEASEILENILYTWKLGDEIITADRVYSEDATVISTVVHSFEGGEMISLGDGTHKVYCTEEGCEAYIIENCAHHTYRQNTDNTHSSLCACEYLFFTEACEIEYIFDEIDSHSGLCASCLRTTEREKCNMSEFAVLPGDEPTTTAAGRETSCCDRCNHKEYKLLNQMAKGYLELSGSNVARIGSLYALDLKLSGNGAPGISAIQLTVTYDPAKFTLLDAFLTEQADFIGWMNTDEAGKIKIGLIADEPITADGILAAMDFMVNEEVGQAEFEIVVEDALLSGTAMDDAGTTDLQLEAIGKSVRVINQIKGDVNMDNKVDISDAILLLRVINGKLDNSLINMESADMDGVGGITTADAILILRNVMDRI